VKADPLIGTRLGDYRIRALIGRGGMARVYEGIDEKLGRRAAIKVVEIQHEHGEEATQRFIREARAVGILDHPNIISVYQFGEEQDLYYMAMKFVEGKTLLNILRSLRERRKFMEPARVVSIVSDVADALDYAHKRGVIHRDIKPSNIMLAEGNRAVLTDFGLTMQLGSETTQGTAFGTPRYIAPEQAISSQRAVPQSDIYSLGVVLYEMVTNRAPFDDDSPMSMALSHITSIPPAPQSIRPDLPHPVQTVILKALEKRPENRWQTATEMAEALRKAYQGVEPDVVLTQEALDMPPTVQAASLPVAPPPDDTAMLSTPVITPDGATSRQGARLPTWPVIIVLVVVAGVFLALSMVFRNEPPSYTGLPTTATPTLRVRLIYSKDAFAIYNPSGQVISLEGVSFVRNDPASRPFEASQLGERTHKALPAGQCLRIRARNVDDRAMPLVCGPQTKPYIYEDPNFVFWAMRSDQDTTTTFLVNRNGRTLQTCSMRLNTCEFPLS